MAAHLRPKLWNDMRDVIEDTECALFGCEQIEWEAWVDLWENVDDAQIIRPRMTVGEFRRIKKALDKLNTIVNSEEYNRIK